MDNLIPKDITTGNPITSLDPKYFIEILTKLGKYSVQIVFAIALIALIITGYIFITSMGDQQKMEQAKKSILYIAIGTGIVLGAWLIVTTILKVFTQNIV